MPLVIKVGAYPDQEALRHVLTAADRAGAAAVAGEGWVGWLLGSPQRALKAVLF